jgi:hypothetical protein
MLPRAVNSVYAKPVTICELNEAFFREVAHMSPFNFEGFKEPLDVT